MRKLVRSKESKKFLTKEGGWTKDVRLAAEFPSVAMALAAIQQQPVFGAEIYYCFDQGQTSEYDFAIPLKQNSRAV